MSDLQVAYVTNLKDFNDYFSIFKKTAKIDSSSVVHCIGLDLEYFSVANFPNIDYSKWIVGKSDNIACVLQLASSSMVLVIHLSLIGNPIPKKIFEVLKSESWIKMGIGVENDLNILSKCYNLGHCSGSIELRNIALMAKIKKPNLGDLYNRLGKFQISKEKPINSQCWIDPLNHSLLKYCVYDAYMSYDLGISILEPAINKIEKPKLFITHKNKQSEEEKEQNQSQNIDSKANYVGQLQELSQTENVPFPVFASSSILDNNDKPLHIVQCKWMNQIYESEPCKNKKTAKHQVCKIALDDYMNSPK